MTVISSTTRRQLTLFVQNKNDVIEKIRKEFNPAQYKLIKAHVTLCREDEIEELEKVIQNIKSIRLDSSLRIGFNPVSRFENGKGVVIKAKKENIEFDNLRTTILKGIIDPPRQHTAHITLMHPRNSTCTDNIFNEIKKYNLPTELSFDKVNLIEQKNGGKWMILDVFQIIN